MQALVERIRAEGRNLGGVGYVIAQSFQNGRSRLAHLQVCRLTSPA